MLVYNKMRYKGTMLSLNIYKCPISNHHKNLHKEI